MKRHTRLAQLSREHHTALRLGRHLLAGGARAELGAELPGIEAHFAEEERDLLPLLETDRHGAFARRLRAEHAQLRHLLAAALSGRDEARAGQALIDHVRFEERELFPVLETLFEEIRP